MKAFEAFLTEASLPLNKPQDEISNDLVTVFGRHQPLTWDTVKPSTRHTNWQPNSVALTKPFTHHAHRTQRRTSPIYGEDAVPAADVP